MAMRSIRSTTVALAAMAKTFYHLDDLKHGEAGPRRLWSHLEPSWPLTIGFDGERVGIIGGSYGGYMVAGRLGV
jgi:hypothetical protein